MMQQMLLGYGGPSLDVSGGNADFTYNGKKIHVFTSSGSLVVAGGPVTLEVFMVGGGGGGGGYAGGGGGAGGVVHHASIDCQMEPNLLVLGHQLEQEDLLDRIQLS